MFFVIRMVGWSFIALAVILLSRDLFAAFGTDHGFHPKTFADLWNMVSPGAPDDFHGWFIFQYGPSWWPPFGIFFALWAFAMFLLIGVGLDYLAREEVDTPHKRAAKAIEKAQKKVAKAAKAS